MNKQLNEIELTALENFAFCHGRNWKSALRACWESGQYPLSSQDDDWVLQRLRNERGPSWLKRFSLPAAMKRTP